MPNLCNTPCCPPCCTPCENRDQIIPTPTCYTYQELENLPQCTPRFDPPPPRCVTIQQPPRVVCRKRVVYVKKLIEEPQLVNRCKNVIIPKVVQNVKCVKVPKLIWVDQLIREPHVLYYPSVVPDPCVVTCQRNICEPREICETMICQPKPQTVDIPPPREYCCYVTGPKTLSPNFECPANPVSLQYPRTQLTSCYNNSSALPRQFGSPSVYNSEYAKNCGVSSEPHRVNYNCGIGPFVIPPAPAP